MSSVESAIYLMVIAYPMVFIVMGLFVALTYLLNKAFPYKGNKERGGGDISCPSLLRYNKKCDNNSLLGGMT